MALKTLLTTLAALSQLKTWLGRFLGWLISPFRAIGRFLFSSLLVPLFHLLIVARRSLHRLYLPAKNRLLFLFSNRLALHFCIVLISIFSVFTNLHPTEVQAEEYGQESVLAAVLGGNNLDVIVEVSGSSASFQAHPTSYRETLALSTPIARDPAFEVIGSESVTNTFLGTNTSSKSSAVAKRSETETYIVEDGDTVSTIAKKFDLSITTVLWANNLSVRSTIRPGDSLAILPVDGVSHKIKSGDTLSRIAKLYGVTTDDVLDANGLQSTSTLSIGDVLLVPGGEQQAPTAKSRVASVSNLFTPSQTSSSGSSERNAIGFIWPTDLHKINVYYGQYYIYGRHTGLDIDCNYSNNNYAAADGIVTFSGWNSGGYGNLVQIDHGNGIVTYYGHHAKLYVRSGQSVSQGDPIGLCGTTGRSSGTHLHFEVRVNGRTTNPLDYL